MNRFYITAKVKVMEKSVSSNISLTETAHT